jgi:predicted O-methyltransferase YrrM
MVAPKRYRVLLEQIELFKPQTILEIGTWNAVNAVKMVKQAQRYHNEIFYYGFDLFEDFDLAEKEHCPKQPSSLKNAQHLLSQTNCYFQLFKGNTKETLRNAKLPPIDFIWFDGGHSLETVYSDWNNIERLFHQDTVVLLDDYYHDPVLGNKYGCRRLITELEEKEGRHWNITFLIPVDAINGGIQVVRLTKA